MSWVSNLSNLRGLLWEIEVRDEETVASTQERGRRSTHGMGVELSSQANVSEPLILYI